MPEISVEDLQKLIEFILEMKAYQEAAAAELRRIGADPASLEAERKKALAALGNIPKVAWIRAHLQQSEGHALVELVQLLRSRK